MMSSVRSGLRPQAGFSLIEMAIVVAIFGILAAISSSYVAAMLPTWRTRSAAMQLAADLNEMRMVAIRDNAQTRVTITTWDENMDDAQNPSAGAWQKLKGNASSASTCWDILPWDSLNPSACTDVNTGAGTVDIGKEGPQKLPWASMEVPDVTTVTFSPRGWVENNGSDFTSHDGYIVFTFTNKRRYIEDGGVEQWIVKVARGGIVRVEAQNNLWVPEDAMGTETTSSNNGSPTGYVGGGSGI